MPPPLVPTVLSSSAAPCTLSELIRSKNVGSWNVDEATLDWKKTQRTRSTQATQNKMQRNAASIRRQKNRSRMYRYLCRFGLRLSTADEKFSLGSYIIIKETLMRGILRNTQELTPTFESAGPLSWTDSKQGVNSRVSRRTQMATTLVNFSLE